MSWIITLDFKGFPLHLLSGNKSGNRRTANIRSIGHSDLFSLSKEDLTDVLSEFPAAKRHLEEKGRQILTKMGMLEDTGDGEAEEAEKVETKLTRLESNLDSLQTKLARLMVELESSNSKMLTRVEQLEVEVQALENQLPENEGVEGGEDERGEGVGQEVEWEREEAEGEEETVDVKVKEQEQVEDNDDVTKEGDGESTKSMREETEKKHQDLERMVEGNGCWEKGLDGGGKKTGDDGEKSQEKGNIKPGKWNGNELEKEGEKKWTREEKRSDHNEKKEKDKENLDKKGQGGEG